MPRRQRIVRGAGETPFALRSALTGETVGVPGEWGRVPLSPWAPLAEVPFDETSDMATAVAGCLVSNLASSC